MSVTPPRAPVLSTGLGASEKTQFFPLYPPRGGLATTPETALKVAQALSILIDDLNSYENFTWDLIFSNVLGQYFYFPVTFVGRPLRIAPNFGML